MTIKTQQESILNYLEAGHNITPLIALIKFESLRLSSIIFRLRKQGYLIETNLIQDDNKNKRFASYRLIGIKARLTKE